ncbi:hypothetical protein GCM10020221_10590 [Streptomyces thioluteus]|uniref:Uncharacterized protein n=1 Tax=Streptomyces thioluteus TaxID=66431 RepID=A0ABN3WIC9_STRTU
MAALPARNAPPWNHTSTGLPLPPSGGVKTFRYRQSSFVLSGLPSSARAGWAHARAATVASRTTDHGVTGPGGRHRRSPTGGAANGIPRKTLPRSVTRPRTGPASVVTTAGSRGARAPAGAGAAPRSASRARRRGTSSLREVAMADVYPGADGDLPGRTGHMRSAVHRHVPLRPGRRVRGTDPPAGP